MVTHCGCKNKGGGGTKGRTTRGQCEFNDKKQVPMSVKSNKVFPSTRTPFLPLLISAQR